MQGALTRRRAAAPLGAIATVAAALTAAPAGAQHPAPTGTQSAAPAPTGTEPAAPPPTGTQTNGSREAPAGAPPAERPEPSPDAAAPREPIEVRVIGDRADALQKIPGSGTFIGAKEMKRSRPANVAEMLRRVPGANVRQDEGGGYRLDVGLRGLDPGRARRVLVLEDGIPIAINPYAEPDLYYVPPVERMRGIEVVKGSGAILFGPQTIGGVIDFVTIAPPTRRTAAVEVEGGQRAFLKLLGTYGDAHGPVRWVVQGLHREGDGFRNEGFAVNDLFAKVAFETSERGEATLKIGIHDVGARSDDVGLTRAMFAEDPRRPTLAPDDRLELRRYELSLIHDHRFSDAVRLTTLAYAYTTARVWLRQRYDRYPQAGVRYERIVGDPDLPSGAIYFRGDNRILDRTYDVAGLEPRAELRFATGPVGHTLSTGARVLVEAAQYEERAGESPRSEAGALLLDERHRSLAFAAYAQDRIAFRDDLLVTPGVRVEHARFFRDILRRPGGAGARDVDAQGESDVTAVVPGIGLVVGTPRAHAFAGVHVGFAPPRVTSAIGPQGDNEQLDAERATHYELGGRASPARWLRVETTGFFSSFVNQVVPSTDPEGLTELVNGGATRHVGVESAAALALADAVSLEAWALDLGARYTFSRAAFAGGPNDGHLLPYAPLHTASATFDAEHRIGLGGQLAWTYVGAQLADDESTLAEDATGRVGLIPAYHLLDATIRYRHERTGLSAFVSAKSLLDQVVIVARRPEGIHTTGFRQITAGVRWDHP